MQGTPNSPPITLDQIDTMMTDPRYRDASHPQHRTMVDMVDRGLKLLEEQPGAEYPSGLLGRPEPSSPEYPKGLLGGDLSPSLGFLGGLLGEPEPSSIEVQPGASMEPRISPLTGLVRINSAWLAKYRKGVPAPHLTPHQTPPLAADVPLTPAYPDGYFEPEVPPSPKVWPGFPMAPRMPPRLSPALTTPVPLPVRPSEMMPFPYKQGESGEMMLASLKGQGESPGNYVPGAPEDRPMLLPADEPGPASTSIPITEK